MEKLSEGLRTMKLEDGENVVMLYGARKKSDKWRSDQPHAGMWGKEIAYALVPSDKPGWKTNAALRFDPTLEDLGRTVGNLAVHADGLVPAGVPRGCGHPG